jgi:hypothetical protein
MTLAELLEKLDKKHIIKLKNGEDHHKLGDDIKVTVYDQNDEEIYFSDCSNVETELEDEDFKNFIVFDFKFIDENGYQDMKSKQAYDIYAIKKVVQNDSTTNT